MAMPNLTPKEWEKVDDLVDNHDMSLEDAISIVQEDKAIDSGKRVSFDLTPEQEKQAKKLANVDTHKPKSNTKRERKPNETKGTLIAELAKFLTENNNFPVENVIIANKEREITFNCGENQFSITLVQHRNAKK